jgi:ribosomal protein S18 acetylase RimI-like enzyme
MVEISMVHSLGGEWHSRPLPDGYCLRWYRDGDGEVWHIIQESTGLYDPILPDLFEREFGGLTELLPARQCFVENSAGVAVGTATAWVGTPDRPAGEGRLHWVAVSPEHQRRGIGSYLSETACSRLRELGSESAYLTTGSLNKAAVQLYLDLGFRPEVGSPAELRAWQILSAILEPRFRAQLGELTA